MSEEEFGQMYEKALAKIETCGLDFRNLVLRIPLCYEKVATKYLSTCPKNQNVIIEYV